MNHESEDLVESIVNQLDELDLGNLEAYSLLHELGELGALQAEFSVVRFLRSEEPDLRKIALSTLLLHWGLKQYKEMALKIAKSDPDPGVRDMAISSLGSVFQTSDDKNLIDLMKQCLSNKNEHWMVREAAKSALEKIKSKSG